jgi:hypothetical protein
MIYTGIGDNSAEIQYREDPLAREIKPDYNKLSMSAWGMPQLNDLEPFNPKIEDNLDSDSDSLRTYVETMSKLKDQANEFFKLGVDITKPSLDPDINDAHLEFNKKYNDALVLAKQSQYSRKLKEDITKNQNKDIYTNPVPYGLITSTDKYIERPDLAGIKAFVDSRKGSRDLAYRNSDYETAKQEIQTGLDAIDQWEQQAIARKPEFASQYKADAELQRAAIKLPFFDQYKHDNLDFKKKKQAEDLGFKYATLNTKGQQVQSDYPDIVMDLINGGGQQKGQLLTGVVVGKTWANANGKDVQVDDVIQETYSAKGSDIKRQLPNTSYKKKGSDNQANIDDNAQYIVLNKTSGREVIKVKNSDGTYDKTGIQYLQSMQAPYDKKQVTPTTDFNFTPNGIVVDQSKSNKTFSKPNTSSNKTTTSIKGTYKAQTAVKSR